MSTCPYRVSIDRSLPKLVIIMSYFDGTAPYITDEIIIHDNIKRYRKLVVKTDANFYESTFSGQALRKSNFLNRVSDPSQKIPTYRSAFFAKIGEVLQGKFRKYNIIHTM